MEAGAPVEWPLSMERRELVVQLASMIRRFGRERFLTLPLARADARDFPDAWEPTLTGVHRVLYRLCWLAYFDPEIAIEDHRPPRPPEHKMLTRSEIELASVADGVAIFHVAAVGNDDVAGMLAHKIGQVFLELAPGVPFRSAANEQATELDGAIAAVCLGLGVLVANAAMYRRHASRVTGRSVVSEEQIETVGALPVVDAALLLAIQDAVRDDYQDALTTLHEAQREWVDKWRSVLEPHEAELRAMLELDDDHEPVALSRRDAPRVPDEVAEPDLRRFNAGRTTFRVRNRKQAPAVLGFFAGALGFVLPFGVFVGPALMLGGAILGRRFSGSYFVCTDPDCGTRMPSEVDVCPRCGGKIAETIAHADQRLERLEELERERASKG